MTEVIPAGVVRTRLIGVLAVLVAIVVLRMTRSVTMPVVAGVLVAALVWPVTRALRRLVPRSMALLVTVLLVIGVLAALFGTIALSVESMGERMLQRRDRLEALQQQLEAVTGAIGMGSAEPRPGGGGDIPADTASGGAAAGGGRGFGQRAASMLVAASSALAFIVAFMALALAEVDETGARIRRRFAGAQAERLITIAQEVATAMQRYFVVKSLTSFITGMATLVITLAFGLDFWYVWGLLAFLLEYVPTIGSILAVIPPALWAAIQFDGYMRPLAVIGTLTVAQLVLGNYVDPKIEGRYMALSPFMVLLSIVFWAWLWGAAGSLMGVPLTVAITTVARHFGGTRWIWALLTQERQGERG